MITTRVRRAPKLAAVLLGLFGSFGIVACDDTRRSEVEPLVAKHATREESRPRSAGLHTRGMRPATVIWVHSSRANQRASTNLFALPFRLGVGSCSTQRPGSRHGCFSMTPIG
jgi:hypothetical protein